MTLSNLDRCTQEPEQKEEQEEQEILTRVQLEAYDTICKKYDLMCALARRLSKEKNISFSEAMEVMRHGFLEDALYDIEETISDMQGGLKILWNLQH